MPVATEPTAQADIHSLPGNRLILCFDGTGNKFQGNPGDTNIVKLYNMLDRGNPKQMHYYQPGIGTYPAEGPVNVGFFRRMWRNLEATIDMMMATTFDAHVIAGYRFIMRYYTPGDRIYIFGFSRGAFTARFLARMLAHVGLLSRGNEELVPFAYETYQDYEKNRGNPAKEQEKADYMNAFKQRFCRTERDAALASGANISANESGIKVHFLGLFDCVNSVGILDFPLFKKVPPLPAVRGTAEHVRHAVAIDERRVKFKVALFAQEQTEVPEDIKEVWFPGSHADIGGGWNDVAPEGKVSNTADDYFQLSDIALKWMVDEVDDVEAGQAERRSEKSKPYEKIAWDDGEKGSFLRRFHQHENQMIKAKLHDMMTWKGGATSAFQIFLWNFMEYLPFIKRWEFVKDYAVKGNWKWDYIALPLNKGSRRDIPSTAIFHHAVIKRMQLPADTGRPWYLPSNHLWVKRKAVARLTRSTANAVSEDSDNVGLAQKNLESIAKSYQQVGSSRHETDPLQRPHFVTDDRSVGSVAIPGEEGIPVGPTEWDQLYRAELD